MSVATAPSEPIRTARAPIVGADSPELAAHLGTRVLHAAADGGVCVALVHALPQAGESSGGTEEAAEAQEPPSPRKNWSRQSWMSTAALTIGRPPRAPRVRGF